MKKNPYAPLPIARANNRLIIGRSCARVTRQEKAFADYAQFFSTSAAPQKKNTILYRIYRDVCARTDCTQFSSHGLRYDLTILPAHALNSLYPTRTVGHIHRHGPHAHMPYPEIYEVMEGSALFIMENATHTIVRCARVNAGEKIIIPPGDGHITVNASRTRPLVIANIFTTTPHIADYAFFKNQLGPSWEPRWEKDALAMYKNPHARTTARCLSVVPKPSATLLPPKQNIYTAFTQKPSAFDFLRNPEHYGPLLTHRALFSKKGNAPRGR
ncbi:MAG: glucose-6-phosphate isomerase family protein [Candidatus Paceibacterota bacterium]|jgi:glucose-6-phosphate isomerase